LSEPDRNHRRAELYTEFLNSLKKESERGSVIVSASLLDDILLQALQAKLLPAAEKKDELFEGGSSPFSTFSSRIDLAYRLCLIRKESRNTFHIVRRIRNDFAHVHDEVSFDSPTTRSRIFEIFKLNKEILESMAEGLAELGINSLTEQKIHEVVGTRKTYEILISSSAAFLLESVSSIEPMGFRQSLC
jgi:hypothetical protein